MRTNRLYAACLLAFGAVVACGGSLTDEPDGSTSDEPDASTTDGPDGPMEASVESLRMNVVSQIAYVQTAPCDPRDASDPGCVMLPMNAVGVLLENHVGPTCENANDPWSGFAGLEQLSFMLYGDLGNPAPAIVPIVPGPLIALPSPSAQGYFASWASPCEYAITTEATSGSVTITQLTATRITGTYDLTYGTHGRLTGPFDAPICDVPLPDADAPYDSSAPYCGD